MNTIFVKVVGLKLEEVTTDLGRHVRDAVVITEAEPVDLPGPRMVWVNQAFTDMTGYTPEEAIGQTPRLLQGPDTDPVIRRRIRTALKAWMPVRETLKNYTKDGEPFWVELDIKPIMDTAGWYRYWVAVQRDVTEEVAQQNELRLAKAAAESANRLKTEFLATMSHEIRTPLNGALGMAQVLKLTELDERQRRAVETIISSGQSLLGLIEDVLDISLVESGSLKLELAPVTARSLIEDTANAVQGVTLSKGLELIVQPGEGSDTPFNADPRRLRQVLINLAGNAAKFTETGQVVLACFARADRMIFEVRDSGPGVPQDSREIIFERFKQGDNSPTREHAGVGLGLSIAREIVTASDGSISVVDAPEGGACFRVSLPFKPASHSSTLPKTGESINGSNGKVLVVEDNPVNREVLIEGLSLSGWAVDTAERGDEGLASWKAGSYDLVIMDHQMPGMNGEETIRLLREHEAAHPSMRRTPVLMLTAHAMVGAEEEALAAGADAYMAKPMELPKLIRLADQLAKRHRTGRHSDRDRDIS